MGGFALEGIKESLTNPAVKIIGKGMAEFQKKVNDELEKKGIQQNISDEQKKLRQKAIFSIIGGLGKQLDIDPSVRLTKVVGLQDLTMYTAGFNKAAAEHREKNTEEHEGVETLGSRLVPRKEKNQRTFGVNMRHAVPFFRMSEFKRMKKAAEALEGLDSSAN